MACLRSSCSYYKLEDLSELEKYHMLIFISMNMCRIMCNTARLKLSLKPLMKFRKEIYRMVSAIGVQLFFPPELYFIQDKLNS